MIFVDEKEINQKDPKRAVISPEMDIYPKKLKEIPDPPEALHVMGDPSVLEKRCIAIVGSRKCTVEGMKTAELIASRLAEAGVTIVSGLAEGIDTAAHRGALYVGGRTVAVLANGIDIYYPKCNMQLQNEITNSGLLVSEYEDGTEARKYMFPKRNRIISGLCEGVIVVEAAIRSGSLITANAAADQGRDVYAVPGMLTAYMSAGTNHLLAEGATPIFDINDFLESLGLESKSRPEDFLESTSFSDLEKSIIKALLGNKELSTNELSAMVGATPREVNGIVTVLELKGAVVTSMGKVMISPALKV